MIDPNMKSQFIGISCGTGVAIFVDFAFYLLRMNIYNAGKLKGKDYKIFGN